MGHKLAIVLLMLGVLAGYDCYAQQTNTVFAQLVSNGTVDTASVDLAPRYLIGQPFHIATLVWSDKPGHSCVNNTIKTGQFAIPLVNIEASFDGVSFTEITNHVRVIHPTASSPANAYRMMASAAGAFPFIRVTYSNWNTTDCVINVFYSGSLSGLDIKAYTEFFTGSNTLLTFPVEITSGTTTTIISAAGQGRLVIYGYQFTNQTTANTVTFNDLRSDSSVVQIAKFTNMAANTVISHPNTNFQIWVTSPGGSLQVTTSSAGPLSGYITFRVE